MQIEFEFLKDIKQFMMQVEHYTDENPFVLRPFVADTYYDNGSIKPVDALWTCPIGSKHSWHDWCIENNFEIKLHRVVLGISLKASIYVVNNKKDALELPWINLLNDRSYIRGLNVREILRQGYDAIWLTEKGEYDTRFMNPGTFYGWDCETICFLNDNPIIYIDGKPRNREEGETEDEDEPIQG